jgi:DUF917 family protein
MCQWTGAIIIVRAVPLTVEELLMKSAVIAVVTFGVVGALIVAPQAQQRPRIRTLTEQEVVDLAVGTAIQGTRASNTDQMIRQAKALLDAGKSYKVVSIDDVPDDWTIVQAAGGIGGGGAWEYVTERIKGQNLPTVPNATLAALEALSKHLGKKFDAIIRNEAAGATLNAFQVATAVDLPVVDACPAGRAKPEVQQSLTFVNGLFVTPAALVTRWGDTVFIDKAVDDYRYEDIARAVAVASGGGVSNARGAMSGRDIKRATIHGQLTEAILFGRTVREAVARNQDPVKALLAASHGYRLFQGTVSKAEPKEERGFNWWDVQLSGTGPYMGHTYRVWVKNENMLSWLDGKPDVMSPDLLYNLDPKTGRSINASSMGGYPLGTEVVMLGRAALAPALRSQKGIDTIGPRHFGFDFDYKPIEETFKTRATFSTE